MVNILAGKRSLTVLLFHRPPRALSRSIIRHLVWASLIFPPVLIPLCFRAAWHQRIL